MRLFRRCISRPSGSLVGLSGLVLALGSLGCQDVTVAAVPIRAIEVQPSSATLLVGQTQEMSFVALDENGNELSGRLVDWGVRDPDVASVGTNGVVTALSTGSTVIEARSEGVTGEAALEVMEAPSIALDPTSVAFEGVANQDDPAPRTVRITNSGSGSLTGLNISVQHAEQQPDGWLSVDLGQTTAPTDLVLEADIDGLRHGTYEATVRVFSEVASNSPQLLPVTLTLEEPPPAIRVNTDVDLSAGRFVTAPDEVAVLVENAGGGELTGLVIESVTYEEGQRDDWLEVELLDSEAPARLRFLAYAWPPGGTFLKSGTYNATVAIGAPDASNSPVAIDVTFVVE